MNQSKTPDLIGRPTYTILLLDSGSPPDLEWAQGLNNLVNESAHTISLEHVEFARFAGKKYQDISMVVLNIKITAEQCLEATHLLTNHGYQGAVILPIPSLEDWKIAKKLVESTLASGKLLIVPCMCDDLLGLIRKTVHQSTVVGRKHPRIQINRQGSIRIAKREIVCLVRDISSGGACIVLDGKESVSNDEEIALSINLNEEKLLSEIAVNTINVRAKVAWFNRHRRTAGVEFVPG